MTPINVSIDHAKLADVPALSLLLNTLFSIEQDFSPNEAQQTAGLQQIIANHKHATIKVARDSSNQVIGMVSVQLVISTAQGGLSAWIEDMIVLEQYRAQGIGRLLINGALDWAKQQGAKRVQLLVDLDNQSAIGYYNHLGWQTSNMVMRRIMI